MVNSLKGCDKLNTDTVKRLIDACFVAKKITELTPPLPKGMVPRHNNIIDAVNELSKEKEHVFISDISRRLNTTTPSITKLVGQLEKMGYLTKISHEEDKRFISLRLTDKGLAHYKAFVEEYHSNLAELLSDLDDRACLSAADTIDTVYDRIKSYNTEKITGKGVIRQ